jgi:hypothetical protein
MAGKRPTATPRELARALNGRVSKYRAQRCEVDGERFDSKREMRRWQELQLLVKAGEISRLERQPSFRLDVIGPNGTLTVGHYRGDFCYFDRAHRRHVEDVKGMDTPLSKWKRKHVAIQYGIDVEIVK